MRKGGESLLFWGRKKKMVSPAPPRSQARSPVEKKEKGRKKTGVPVFNTGEKMTAKPPRHRTEEELTRRHLFTKRGEREGGATMLPLVRGRGEHCPL